MGVTKFWDYFGEHLIPCSYEQVPYTAELNYSLSIDLPILVFAGNVSDTYNELLGEFDLQSCVVIILECIRNIINSSAMAPIYNQVVAFRIYYDGEAPARKRKTQSARIVQNTLSYPRAVIQRQLLDL